MNLRFLTWNNRWKIIFALKTTFIHIAVIYLTWVVGWLICWRWWCIMLNCVGCEVGNYGINTFKKFEINFFALTTEKSYFSRKGTVAFTVHQRTVCFFYISKKIKQDNKMAMFWKNKIKKNRIANIWNYAVSCSIWSGFHLESIFSWASDFKDWLNHTEHSELHNI